MDFDQIITVFASIATCITAIIILLTLLEMKKQRSMTYRPTLVPTRQLISAKQSKGHFNWQDKKTEIEGIDTDHFGYSLHVFNLGNGAAKNINVAWEFNIESVVTSVNSLFQKNMSQAYIEINNRNWLSIKGDDINHGMVNINLDMEGQYDYLLPASIDKSGLAIRIPYTFITLVSHYFNEASKQLKNNEESLLSNTPNIDLILTFEDISGAKYMVKYILSVNLIMISESVFQAELNYKSTS